MNMMTFVRANAWFTLIVITLIMIALAVPVLGSMAAEPEKESDSEAGIAYLVLYDVSPSMANRPANPNARSWSVKLDEVKRQASVFIESLPSETEVRFFSFSSELEAGPAVSLKSRAGRDELQAFIKGLQAKGRETRLWRSLDRVLAEAKELAEQEPGRRIRVLAYSDGEDNEKPPATKPEDVLTKYRTFLRESNVQLTYVTIGFELQAQVQQSLEREGVIVRKAVLPEEIIPLQPEFRFLKNEVHVDEEVVVLDDSIGVIRDRAVDWGDGSPVTRGRSPQHIYRKPGEYTVRLTVWSTSDETRNMTRKVRVTLPPAPKAAFKLAPAEVQPGQKTVAINESTGVRCSYAWRCAEFLSEEKNPHLSFTEAGEYVVRLTVTDTFGRSDFVEYKIRVVGPTPPKAEAHVPERSSLGNRSRLIDRSVGEIKKRSWYVDDRLVSTERDVDWEWTTTGRHVVRLSVEGPGGSNSATYVVEVVAPEAPRVAIVGPDAVMIGVPVKFFARYTGAISEYRWLVDGATVSTTEEFSTSFMSAGKRDIQLQAIGPGGTQVARHAIQVRAPAPPTPAFQTPEAVTVGTLVELVDRSEGTIESYAWRVGGKLVAETRDVSYRFESIGEQIVGLEVRGPGGQRVVERKILVKPFDPPRAKLVLGTKSPRVGDEVTVTDVSEGDVQSATWLLPGRPEPLQVSYASGVARSISWNCTEAGDVQIKLTVQGRGGEHQTTLAVGVESRHVAPQASITIHSQGRRAPLLITFKNRSSGSVHETEYDFGDGSPVLRVAGIEDVVHEYGPGEFVPKVRLIGPPEFAPAVVEIPVRVAPPLPAWLPHLWWAVPLVMLTIGGAGTFAWQRRRSLHRRRQLALLGQLRFKPASDNSPAAYKSKEFSGPSAEQEFELADETRALLKKEVDPLSNEIEYTIEVKGNGYNSGRIVLPPYQPIRIAGYVFEFTPYIA